MRDGAPFRAALVRCGVALVCAGATGAHAQPMRHATRAVSPYTASLAPIVMEVRIDDELHRTIIAREDGEGSALLPLHDLLAFAGVRFSHRFGITAARRSAPRPGFALNVQERVIHIADQTIQLSPIDLLVDGGVPYVSDVLAARVLNVPVLVDVANASVQLRDASALPVARRRDAVQRARRLDSTRVTLAPGVELIPTHRNALQADYNFFLRRNTQVTPSASGGTVLASQSAQWSADLDARLSGRVRGGSLSGRVTSTDGAPVRDLQWARYRAASTKLTHVTLGALDAGGLTGARINGFSIDNFPVDYAARRMIRVRGRATDGWEYTALQDGRWSTADRTDDGSYEFRLPMIGDVARVDVVGWGPDGQERRYVRSVHAAPLRVRRGELQYAATGGRCSRQRNVSMLVRPGTTRCDWFAGADSRYGLTDWLVMRGGVDAIPGTVAPYVGFGGVVGQSLTLQGSTTLGRSVVRHGAWSAQYEPSPALSAAMARSTRITGATTELASLHLAPLRWSGRYAVDAWATGTRSGSTESRVSHAGLIGMRNGLRAEVFARTSSYAVAGAAAQTMGATGTEITAAPSWLHLPGVPRVWVSASAQRQTRGGWQSAYRVNGSLQRAYVEVARTMAAAGQPSRWTVTVSPRSNTVRQTTMYARSASVASLPSQSTLLHAVSGSAAWESGQRRPTFAVDPATNRGTIAGLTYLDLNANGRQDAREPGVGDVSITIGNRAMVSDSLGRFRTPHVTASEMLDVIVDSTSMPSACWRASAQRWRVRATEGGVTAISLPIWGCWCPKR